MRLGSDYSGLLQLGALCLSLSLHLLPSVFTLELSNKVQKMLLWIKHQETQLVRENI